MAILCRTSHFAPRMCARQSSGCGGFRHYFESAWCRRRPERLAFRSRDYDSGRRESRLWLQHATAEPHDEAVAAAKSEPSSVLAGLCIESRDEVMDLRAK